MITWPKGVASLPVLSRLCRAESQSQSDQTRAGARLVITANLAGQAAERVMFPHSHTGVTQNVKLSPEKDNVTRGLLFRPAR